MTAGVAPMNHWGVGDVGKVAGEVTGFATAIGGLLLALRKVGAWLIGFNHAHIARLEAKVARLEGRVALLADSMVLLLPTVDGDAQDVLREALHLAFAPVSDESEPMKRLVARLEKLAKPDV